MESLKTLSKSLKFHLLLKYSSATLKAAGLLQISSILFIKWEKNSKLSLLEFRILIIWAKIIRIEKTATKFHVLN